MSYTKSPNSKYSRRKPKPKGQIALIPIRGKDTPALFSSKDQKHHCENCGWGTPTNLGRQLGEGVDCRSKENAMYLDSLSGGSLSGGNINMDTFKESGFVALLKGEKLEGDQWSCHFWESKDWKVAFESDDRLEFKLGTNKVVWMLDGKYGVWRMTQVNDPKNAKWTLTVPTLQNKSAIKTLMYGELGAMLEF